MARDINDLIERFTREWRDAKNTDEEMSTAAIGAVTMLGELIKEVRTLREAVERQTSEHGQKP